MATNYGSDTYCLTDLQLIDTIITDPRQIIGQRIARRLQVQRGALALINDDPNGGFDIRQYLNAKMGPGEIASAQSAIEAECLKDEEVQSASVSMTLDAGNLSISIRLAGASGPFQLVLNVSQITTDVIFSFGGQP